MKYSSPSVSHVEEDSLHFFRSLFSLALKSRKTPIQNPLCIVLNIIRPLDQLP